MVSIDQLTDLGINPDIAMQMHLQINSQSPEKAWQYISKNILSDQIPFTIHLAIFNLLFPAWHQHPESAPAWMPTQEIIENSNINKFMTESDMQDIHSFHRWSVGHYQDFWRNVVNKLHIHFTKKSPQICDLSAGVESPRWFPDAELNIANSCFTAPSSATALLCQDQHKKISRMTYGELDVYSNRIANSLVKKGFKKGDAIGIAMTMNIDAIAIYLGIIKMGGIVVSIADSFSSSEIAVRLKIANARAVFTQEFIVRAGKQLPLYEKVCEALAPAIIVLPCDDKISLPLRSEDYDWTKFLGNNEVFTAVDCDPMSPCNILFSSGTTADPKAIVWNHTTPIKAASDAYFHQNIQPDDVLAWPTNIGWMMGPWLIFAALINHAAIALYPDAPRDRAFGEYIQNAKVTMLGVVPTLVATWRQSNCMAGLNWQTIKVYSSTGECSNPEDMLYLMSLAHYKPVIEYCGGTEIGGSYLSSTVIENNYPSLFTTPAMGLNITIIDEQSNIATEGEVAIIPPSIGLSTELLNANHHQVYFENMPATPDGNLLRRHGDQITKLPGNLFCIMGRVDDSMNLGGIKVSSAEIERVLTDIPHIAEVAAVAVTPLENGPSQLVIYAATLAGLDKKNIMSAMQAKINSRLNPLFKIFDVVFISELPKTASNKIMRRVLRKQYQDKRKHQENSH